MVLVMMGLDILAIRSLSVPGCRGNNKVVGWL